MDAYCVAAAAKACCIAHTAPVIDDLFHSDSAYTTSGAAMRKPDGHVRAVTSTLTSEHLLTVSAQDIPFIRMVCTPMELPQLVVGYLYSEGIIDSINKISRVQISSDGALAVVQFSGVCNLPTPHTVHSAAQGKPMDPGCDCPLSILPPYHLDMDEVFALARALEIKSDIYRKTRGVHSCILRCCGTEIFCEDIGRHNALDKVIGTALLAGLDLHNAVVYTSGRVPLDMVTKVIRCGVPVFVSKSVPTIQAVEMAARYGLTLIGTAKPDAIQIFVE